MVLTAYRQRCEADQARAKDTAERWGESPAMAFLFRQLDTLEAAEDEAAGVEGADEIRRVLSRAADDLRQIAEQVRDDAIDAAVSACEFVDDAAEPSVGWQGSSADEQSCDFRDDLAANLPTVAQLVRQARTAARA